MGLISFGFWLQIKRKLPEWRARNLVMLLFEGTQIFTLFVVFCSWFQMIWLSDTLMEVLSINILVGLLLSPLTSKQKVQYLFIAFILLFVLAQHDPDVKVSLFKTSSLKLDILKPIFSHKLLNGSIMSVELLLYLRYELSLSDLNRKARYFKYMRILIAFLIFCFYISAYVLSNTMHFLAQLQSLLILCYIVSFWVVGVKISVEEIKFLSIGFLSIFMGPQFPVVLGVCLILDKCLQYCPNYAVLMSLLAKIIWWF